MLRFEIILTRPRENEKNAENFIILKSVSSKLRKEPRLALNQNSTSTLQNDYLFNSDDLVVVSIISLKDAFYFRD